MALLKILKKFKKNFFSFSERSINIDEQIQCRFLQEYLETRQFKVSNQVVNEDLRALMTDLKLFYAEIFWKGNMAKGTQELNAVHNTIRKKDAVVIAMFGGACVILMVFLMYFIFVEPKNGYQWQ